MTKPRILTFEIVPDGTELEIHLDVDGLNSLVCALQRLANAKSPLPRHDHLMTPSWAGNELTEERQGERNILLNKVTLRLWR